MLAELVPRFVLEAEKRAIEQTRGGALRNLLTGRCQDEGGAIRELDSHGRCVCGSDNVTECAHRWVKPVDYKA